MRTVVGLDLSLTCTGIVRIIEGTHGARTDTVTSKGTKEDTLDQRHQRLVSITSEVCERVGHPDLICVEGPSFASKGGHNHDRSGLWWMALDLLLIHLQVAVVPPSSLKKFATGRGTASKLEVVDAVARRWPEVQTGGDDNVADALVLAKMGVHHLGMTSETMPKVNMTALDGVAWPGTVA